MDRIINVNVSGHHLTKDNNTAGVRGECNVTILRITLDASWVPFKKVITFWDAHEGPPVGILLNGDLEEKTEDEKEEIYCVPIPQEALLIAGKLTFVIDGVDGNRRQRSVSCELVVEDSLVAPSDTVEPTNPTLSLIEQLRLEVDNHAKGAEYSKEQAKDYMDAASLYADAASTHATSASVSATYAEGFKDEAYGYFQNASSEAVSAWQHSENARVHADRAWDAVVKVPYIGDNGNWFAWNTLREEFYDTDVKAQSDPVDDALSATSTNPVQNKAVTKRLVNIEKKADEALSFRNLPYRYVDLADLLHVMLETNTVNYAFGEVENGTIDIALSGNAIREDMSEETVLILDLTSLTNTPTIAFNGFFGEIKWLNGEPPIIEAGKAYMFSFTRAKKPDVLESFYLGIGGEFC